MNHRNFCDDSFAVIYMIYTIGIDIGTSGTKSILIDETGKVYASHTVEYPMYQPQNGYAEQNPEDWYQAAVTTVETIVKDSKIDPTQIKAIGLSGQMHGLVMLDENHKVIRPAILWCDTRTGEECSTITKLVGKERLLNITANPAIAGFTAAKIMWVKKHEPQNYARCKKILLPKDYVRYRMTGEFATEVSDASGTQLLDIKNRCWSDEVLAKLDIDRSLLATVYESPDITGRINLEFSRKTSVSNNVIVVGGAGDNAAAAVGTGVVEDNKAFTTIGTSGVLFAHTSKMRIDQKGRVHTFCCAVPGQWHVMGVTQAAGLSMKWFRDNFCETEILQAKAENVDSYYLLDKIAKEIPIGADRLIYLPYLMGERTPHLNTNARGVFFGLSAIHTKAHFIRAVLEGVSYSLRDCKEVLAEMGIAANDMMLCGGGAKSPLWRHMLADIYATEVSIPKSGEGAALGVAILALVGAGIYPTVPEACRAIIKKDTSVKPDLSNTEEYEKFYHIYRGLYPQLKQAYQALNQA